MQIVALYSTISRLGAAWWDARERWQHRDLGTRRMVWIRADGAISRRA